MDTRNERLLILFKFLLTGLLICSAVTVAQAADKIKKAGKAAAPATSPAETKQLVINGTFIVEPTSDGYGYNFYLMPDQNNADEFPNLSYSGAKLFLKFIDNEISFELRDLQRFKGIKGFDEYYEGIKDLDIYALKAKETEIRTTLKTAHSAYTKEYNKYLRTTFIIDQDDLIPVAEKDYNIDSEAVTNIHLPFAQRIMPRVYGGNFSDPYEAIMKNFGEQSTYPKWNFDRFRTFNFKIPLTVAKKYFDGFSGTIGSRMGACLVRYWVTPTRGAITGVRLWITGMNLKRVEVLFLGKERFAEIWLPGRQFMLSREYTPFNFNSESIRSQGEKLIKDGEYEQAASLAKFILAQDERVGGAHYILAALMDRDKDYQAAADHYSKAAQFAPSAETYNSLAWFLVSCPDESKRDKQKALEFAKKAADLDASHFILDTLAAAYAANDQFDLALQMEKMAYEKNQRDEYISRIADYEQKNKSAVWKQKNSDFLLTQKIITSNGQFIAFDNDTVLDTTTSLMWTAQESGTTIDWQSANMYCESNRVGDYTDWRLPSKEELMSIVDKSRNPAIDASVFPNTRSDSYWSSTTDTNNAARAWAVCFRHITGGVDRGEAERNNKTSRVGARCVRRVVCEGNNTTDESPLIGKWLGKILKKEKLLEGDTFFDRVDMQIDSVSADGAVSGSYKQYNNKMEVIDEGPLVGFTINQATGKVVVKGIDKGKEGVLYGAQEGDLLMRKGQKCAPGLATIKLSFKPFDKYKDHPFLKKYAISWVYEKQI